MTLVRPGRQISARLVKHDCDHPLWHVAPTMFPAAPRRTWPTRRRSVCVGTRFAIGGDSAYLYLLPVNLSSYRQRFARRGAV
jgi:hypothetical protein